MFRSRHVVVSDVENRFILLLMKYPRYDGDPYSIYFIRKLDLYPKSSKR